MVTVRKLVKEYLLAGVFNTVTGYNDKSVQYQGDEKGRKVFGLYNEEGNWERETFDIELALDYIGLERSEKYNPVYEAYRILTRCKDGEEAVAIEDAIGYLGEALE